MAHQRYQTVPPKIRLDKFCDFESQKVLILSLLNQKVGNYFPEPPKCSTIYVPYLGVYLFNTTVYETERLVI